jgi:hypothetical protein
MPDDKRYWPDGMIIIDSLGGADERARDRPIERMVRALDLPREQVILMLDEAARRTMTLPEPRMPRITDIEPMLPRMNRHERRAAKSRRRKA